MIKNITLAIILGITIFAFYFLYNQQKIERGDISAVKQNIADIRSQINTNSNQDNSKIIGSVEKYGGEVLQIGGVGSRFNQTTAYLLTEQGYLKPPDDWVKVSFNSPADIMDVNCREGYTLTSCKVSDKVSNIDNVLGCRGVLENKMQNITTIECKKK